MSPVNSQVMLIWLNDMFGPTGKHAEAAEAEKRKTQTPKQAGDKLA